MLGNEPFTDQGLKALKAPRKGRVELSDGRSQGLTFRLTDKGVRSFSFRFRCPITGRVQRYTIGDYPDVTLAKARVRADELRVAVANGQNPVDDRRRDRETRATRAFEAVGKRYLAEWAERNKAPSSVAQDRRALDKHVLPKWRHRNITTLRRGDITDLLQGIVDAGTPVQANRVQALISKVFSFAVDQGLVEANPCARLPKQGGKETPAKRYLQDPEIPEFWKRCGTAAMRPETGLALRLILLTGVRAAEAAGMAKAEIKHLDDPTAAFWEIPGERTKNGLTHVVPLSEPARQTVLDALRSAKEGQPYVFPSPVRAGESVQAHSLTVAMQRMAEHIEGDAAKTWKADPPSPHDLRRTFRTKLSALGIPKDVRDRLMNHAPRDVGERHYDQYDFLREKRDGLTRWANALSELLTEKEKVAA